MLGKMSLVGGVLAAAAFLSPVPASASIAGPIITIAPPTNASMLQSAHWWRWRRDDDDSGRYWRRYRHDDYYPRYRYYRYSYYPRHHYYGHHYDHPYRNYYYRRYWY